MGALRPAERTHADSPAKGYREGLLGDPAATLDFWLTLGSEGAAFEKELAGFLCVRHSLLVNAGSSANLITISVLTSPRLPADRRIGPRNEVITVTAGFLTTVAPIVQLGAVPVFIDADPTTGNARCEQL